MIYYNEFELDWSNCHEDLKIKVYGDYQPYEERTWHYPGCDEHYELEEVIVAETGARISLLGDSEEEIRIMIIEKIHEEKDYAKYGYMMGH